MSDTPAPLNVNTLTIPQFLERMANIPPWQRKLFILEWQRYYCQACGGTLTEETRPLCWHCVILGVRPR